MRIINLKNNTLLADRVKVADTFWGRLIGLLNRKSLEKGGALILKPSCSVHTLFMRFAIDVLFLDKKGKIIAVHSSFKPFRLSPIYFHANLTIEFPANTLKLTDTQKGDYIKIT